MEVVRYGLCIILLVCCSSAEYLYETKYLDVPLDHFSFTSNYTFKLRYLVNNTYHAERGPIFFYTGNEGDIDMFAQNTGFMNDIVEQFGALLVFAEHRYYGKSLPFGNKSYVSPEYLGYLSSEQAMADFVLVIDALQKHYKSKDDLGALPVVAFGGSYGGMLAAWFRMKYPASVVGSIASSAPIWFFQGLTSCGNFFKVTSSVYTTIGGSKCSDTIAKSWATIRSLAKTDAGKASISKAWNLCTPLTDDKVNDLIEWLSDIIVNIAEVNYPYPNSFLVELPGNPVKEFCNRLDSVEYNDDIGLVKSVAAGVFLYANYSGKAKCVDTGNVAEELGVQGWNFQACTEMVQPLCSTDDDIFENTAWDYQEYSDTCYKTFGVRPRSDQIAVLRYGGKDITAASNIVFSNGLLDPWSSSGVLSSLSPSLPAVVIPDGAHHSDLRARNALDSDSLLSARRFHIQQIRKWLNEFYFENVKDNLKQQFLTDNDVRY